MIRILSNTGLSADGDFPLRHFGQYAPAGSVMSWSPEGERRDMQEILAAIPREEAPDILVIASPEYLPIPWDVSAFPGPKVLLITDWNVCLRFLPDICPLFDFCFTDLPGYRLLRRLGLENVHHQPLFGHDPGRFRDLRMDRNLDVSFCGNFNPGLHGERNALVARIARWAEGAGRPVQLRQAFGDEYVEILNRSRLVFNYSIRGEANMRLFESMACGAAALVEEGNQEVPTLFREGVHYFGYAPERLEERLDELLAQPERIAAVAEAGRREAAKHSKAKQMEALLEKVTGAGTSGAAGWRISGEAAAPGSKGAPSPRGLKALAKIRVLGAGYTIPEALEELRKRAQTLPGLDTETFPGLLLSLLQKHPGAGLDTAKAILDRYLAGDGIPEPLRCLFRMQEAEARGDGEAAARWAEAGRRTMSEIGKGLNPYDFFLAPAGLAQGLNTELNRAFRSDAEQGSREGYGALLKGFFTRGSAENRIKSRP